MVFFFWNKNGFVWKRALYPEVHLFGAIFFILLLELYYKKRGLFIWLPFAARLLHSSRQGNESRDAFKCYIIIITYQRDMRVSFVRKVVDVHEPLSHIWRKYLELVSGPGWHYRIHVDLRRNPESQLTGHKAALLVLVWLLWSHFSFGLHQPNTDQTSLL